MDWVAGLGRLWLVVSLAWVLLVAGVGIYLPTEVGTPATGYPTYIALMVGFALVPPVALLAAVLMLIWVINGFRGR